MARHSAKPVTQLKVMGRGSDSAPMSKSSIIEGQSGETISSPYNREPLKGGTKSRK